MGVQGPSFEPWFILASLRDKLQPEPSKLRYCLGLFYILLQCVVWIFASITTQLLYNEHEIHSPFLMTYTGVCLLAFLLPIKILTDRAGWTEDLPSLFETDSFDAELANARNYQDIWETVSTRSKTLSQVDKGWNHKKHFFAALHIAPAMFMADIFFNKGLQHTSVASTTVLVSTSCVFVFLYAVALRLEAFHMMKLAGVLLGVAGTAMTTLGDASNEDTGDMVLWGDLCAIVASALYAAYTVQVRILCPQDEELYSMQLLLGYVGVICTITFLPFALYTLWHVYISWPALGILFVKGTLDFVVTDYLLFKSVILTNPTVASVGLGLTIPLAYIADYIMGKNAAFTVLSAMGPATVALGFLIVNLYAEDPTSIIKNTSFDGSSDNSTIASNQDPQEESGMRTTTVII